MLIPEYDIPSASPPPDTGLIGPIIGAVFPSGHAVGEEKSHYCGRAGLRTNKGYSGEGIERGVESELEIKQGQCKSMCSADRKAI